jgi:hypothetical protein
LILNWLRGGFGRGGWRFGGRSLAGRERQGVLHFEIGDAAEKDALDFGKGVRIRSRVSGLLQALKGDTQRFQGFFCRACGHGTSRIAYDAFFAMEDAKQILA